MTVTDFKHSCHAYIIDMLHKRFFSIFAIAQSFISFRLFSLFLGLIALWATLYRGCMIIFYIFHFREASISIAFYLMTSYAWRRAPAGRFYAFWFLLMLMIGADARRFIDAIACAPEAITVMPAWLGFESFHVSRLAFAFSLRHGFLTLYYFALVRSHWGRCGLFFTGFSLFLPHTNATLASSENVHSLVEDSSASIPWAPIQTHARLRLCAASPPSNWFFRSPWFSGLNI